MYSTRILVMPVDDNINAPNPLAEISGDTLTEAQIKKIPNTECYKLPEFIKALNNGIDTGDSTDADVEWLDVGTNWFGWVIADEVIREDSIEDKYNKLRKAISDLADDLSEKRSDICEILTYILEKGHWADRDVYKTEHRFITAKVPDGAVLAQYDTLCTEISFQMPDGEWEIGEEHTYED